MCGARSTQRGEQVWNLELSSICMNTWRMDVCTLFHFHDQQQLDIPLNNSNYH